MFGRLVLMPMSTSSKNQQQNNQPNNQITKKTKQQNLFFRSLIRIFVIEE